MARQKEVLSVTVTVDCIKMLEAFVKAESQAGWSTNKSQVVNNAVMEYIQRNSNRNQVLPQNTKSESNAD